METSGGIAYDVFDTMPTAVSTGYHGSRFHSLPVCTPVCTLEHRYITHRREKIDSFVRAVYINLVDSFLTCHCIIFVASLVLYFSTSINHLCSIISPLIYHIHKRCVDYIPFHAHFIVLCGYMNTGILTIVVFLKGFLPNYWL